MWSGDYPDWTSAMADCRPGGVGPRCEAYSRAHQAVLRGEAHHERDGILVQAPWPEWPLLTALATLPPSSRPSRTVLDFGGGFASAFYQNRAWLSRFGTVQWAVVEMPEVAQAARATVSHPQVQFFESIHQATEVMGPPDIVIAAGVLPYAPKPADLLDKLAALRAPWTLLNRIAVLPSAARHRITRQVVPRRLYRMESPFWFFAPQILSAEMALRFQIAGSCASQCDDPGWIGGQRFEWLDYLLAPIPR